MYVLLRMKLKMTFIKITITNISNLKHNFINELLNTRCFCKEIN